MNCIDYSMFVDALRYYDNAGFQQIEVPWWVTADIANITKPPDVPSASNYMLSVNGKCLLASGEQAFLYLANKGQLPYGKYQTVTPCFRNEIYDAHHAKQFMKLELIELLDQSKHVSSKVLNGLVDKTARLAAGFFKLRASGYAGHVDIVNVTDEEGKVDPLAPERTYQLDVVMRMADGECVELGSYGVRQTSFAIWLYGTGVAEPRFSKALRERIRCR